ncbi:hypothetical protein PoB_003296500 [Plakobranchus ocellatus]|uniref:Uncharacterized protein n=1 Tax=Plakobranchus ocellatus TaxID=259542 RepID=A0AAV4AE67_9GAST|nr:hypothetical protein PoB_003296500 [Plakobranchus ocellatus]
MPENKTETTLGKMKTRIKAAVRTRWIKYHPFFSAYDQYHTLNRVKQTTIFWLRTGHNRLRKHMYTKLKIGETPICQRGQGLQSPEHNLRDLSKPSHPQAPVLARAHHPDRKSV